MRTNAYHYNISCFYRESFWMTADQILLKPYWGWNRRELRAVIAFIIKFDCRHTPLWASSRRGSISTHLQSHEWCYQAHRKPSLTSHFVLSVFSRFVSTNSRNVLHGQADEMQTVAFGINLVKNLQAVLTSSKGDFSGVVNWTIVKIASKEAYRIITLEDPSNNIK